MQFVIRGHSCVDEDRRAVGTAALHAVQYEAVEVNIPAARQIIGGLTAGAVKG